MSKTQCALLESYRLSLVTQRQTELQAKIKQAIDEAEDELPPPRSVIPLLRVRLVPVGGLPSSCVLDCQLSVWRPSEGTQEELREGKPLKIFNLMASTGRYGSVSWVKVIHWFLSLV